MYGKIKDGNLIMFKGDSIRYNGRVYVNPTDEQIKAAGWKEVVESEQPEPQEGYYAERKLTQRRGKIYITYELKEIPEIEEEGDVFEQNGD